MWDVALMRTNNQAVLLLLFLFLATAPPALVFAHYYGILQLPQLDYDSVMVFATAALFLLPVFFVLLAAVAVLIKKGKERGSAAGVAAKRERALKPVHYPWESVFRIAEKEEFKAARAKVKAAFAAPKLAPELNATALLVVAVIVAATVIFFAMVVPTAKDVFTTGGKGSNLTNLTNLSLSNISADMPDKVVKNESALLHFFKTRLSSLRKTNETSLAEEAKAAEAKKSAEAAKKEVAAKQKQEKEAEQKGQEGQEPSALATILATKFKAAALKAFVFWPHALVGIGVLVLLAGGFYFYKTKKIRPSITIELFRTAAADFAEWFAVLFMAARKNSIKIVAVTIALAAAIAVFVFSDQIRGKLSGFNFPANLSDSFFDLAFAVRDFFSAYRLYIVIGIIALLVILGILFVLERKGKELETVSVKTKASKK